MYDAIALDAFRLLVRYGAPVDALLQLSQTQLIERGRAVIPVPVAGRPAKVAELFVAAG